MATHLQRLTVVAALCAVAPGDRSIGEGPRFESTVDSLRQYACPEWFRDAKFGVYLHWGPYSVAEQGEWYARKLYVQGTPEYEHHVATYGHPSQFGYADFIPQWKAERFDPDELLALFKRAGAKYFTPCAVHHDNFDLWDSKHHRWNAVEMGPRKDLIGMWRTATLKAGLRFGVTTHLSRSYSWLATANGADESGPLQGVPYDGAQGKASGLYPPNAGQEPHSRAPLDTPAEWRSLWAKRVKQLVTDYTPDLLYFDCAVPFRGTDRGRTGLDVIAHFYNERPEGVMCIKERPWQGLYAEGIATVDYERGLADHLMSEPWQTDDSIGSWGYNRSAKYAEPDLVVDKLVDIVAKNGNLLLNIPIKADGTLDKEATTLLNEVGAWLDVNGEAIYGTRPWFVYGDGSRSIQPRALKSLMTFRDVRYTQKAGVLYATVLAWPEEGTVLELPYVVSTFNDMGKISKVHLLGSSEPPAWEAHPDGLRVTMPQTAPCKYAYVLKIELAQE